MERDGFRESVWQVNMPNYKARETAIDSAGYDVVIVGGGVTGIATALEMQKSGLRCLVAEARSLCFGTTGGTTAHLNNFFDSTYAEVQKSFGKDNAVLLANTANEALGLYRQNVSTLKIDCDYVENEGYLFALDQDQADQLKSVYEASRQAGIAVRESREIPVPIASTAAIVYENQAQIHPVKYVYGLATAFENAGGTILQHCRAGKVTPEEKSDPDGWLIVETTLGDLRAKRLVYATHTPPGIRLLDFRLSPWRSYVLACRLEDDRYPANPAYDMGDPYRYYRTQQIDGRPYLIAGGEDHPTGKEPDTEEPFRKLEKYVRQHFRVEEISKRWSSQYFDPADGLAYIGRMGSEKNIYVACGFAGNGMTYSHIAARLLTALAKGEQPPEAVLFSPGRLKPVAALGNELKSAAAVAAGFVGDRFKIKKLTDEAGLPRDQGKLIRQEGENLAVYHDENGKFHTLSPVCTHLGCIVQWNQAEKSWDCPCHGARYNVDGEMITGPADRDLPVHTPAF